ncbi:unknown [Clostridium sp. CAG:492]|nr:unknown [Clostridium sp. CAG:492]
MKTGKYANKREEEKAIKGDYGRVAKKILNIINENKSGKGGKDDKGGMEK